MAEITRESPISSAEALPLDDRLYKLADAELDFLKATVDQDEDRIRERVLTVQRKPMTLPPVGTDVRKLALDGYPASNIVGCDLHSAYIDLGHELYQDSNETCPIRFITDDMFDIPLNTVKVEHRDLSEITNLSQLIGRVKYLYIGAVFHLFNESTQLAIAQRLTRLVSREDGVVIFGRHQGSETPSLVGDNVWRKRFTHSPNSWKKLWEDVFTETDGEEYAKTRVTVNVELSRPNILKNLPGPFRQLTWSVHLRRYLC